MNKISKLFIIIFLLFSSLFATIGDWESYGNLTTLYDLNYNNDCVLAASNGGLIEFDQQSRNISIYTNNNFLDNINISYFHIDKIGTYWIGYDSNPTKITYYTKNGKIKHYDFQFSKINTIASDSNNILIAYEKNLTKGIAHFVRNNDEYAFKDFYEQFPIDLGKIHSLQIFDNKIYIGSTNGLLTGNLNNPNLKPSEAWTIINNNDTRNFYSFNDTLFLTQNNSIYYLNDNSPILSSNGITTYSAVTFSSNSQSLFYANIYHIYKKTNNNWEQIYSTNRSDKIITGLTCSNEKLFFGIRNEGLIEISFDGNILSSFIPNSPIFTRTITFRSLAIDNNGNVYIAHNDGIDIFRQYYWHDLIKADSTINISSSTNSNSFSSDTLAYSIQKGTEGATWDMYVSSNNYLYFTLTDYHTSVEQYLDYEPIVGLGVFFKLNLNDYYEYSLYDTTDDIFHGTENLGGTDEYIKMRGIAESSNGDIWVVNAHVGNNESLVCFKSDSSIEKYSTTETGSELQLLPNELVFDDHGRLIIGNTQNQENPIITEGGVTIFDIKNDEWYLINESNGLANNNVLSLCKDTDGSIWIATSSGVQNIRTNFELDHNTFDDDVSHVFNTFNQGSETVLRGLTDVNVRKIRIDVRGNVWFLTENSGIRIYKNDGTWFNSGYGYTEDNSPLLSNTIYDVVFDDENGYAYILTPSGLNRVETAWKKEIETTSNIIIFPQPFDPDKNDRIVFDNLPDQSEIKISTINGRVISTISTNDPNNYGNQIIWDGILDNGKKISRGVYLVLIHNVDGLSEMKKLAVY